MHLLDLNFFSEIRKTFFNFHLTWIEWRRFFNPQFTSIKVKLSAALDQNYRNAIVFLQNLDKVPFHLFDTQWIKLLLISLNQSPYWSECQLLLLVIKFSPCYFTTGSELKLPRFEMIRNNFTTHHSNFHETVRCVCFFEFNFYVSENLSWGNHRTIFSGAISAKWLQ